MDLNNNTLPSHTSLSHSEVSSNPGVPGAVNGLWQGQHERLDELDARLVERQFPDRPLQPNFRFHAVPTKYSHFPIIDRRVKPQVPIRREEPYNTATNFSPATSNGPVASYLANIDLETVLQNRHVSLQHGADQGVYVPSSKSDLYGFAAVGRQEDMGDRSMIFDKHGLATRGSDVARQIGHDRFHNNTRTQLRGL